MDKYVRRLWHELSHISTPTLLQLHCGARQSPQKYEEKRGATTDAPRPVALDFTCRMPTWLNAASTARPSGIANTLGGEGQDFRRLVACPTLHPHPYYCGDSPRLDELAATQDEVENDV